MKKTIQAFVLIALSQLFLGTTTHAEPHGDEGQQIWTHCANEGEICKVPGNARMFRYGASGKYVEIPVGDRSGRIYSGDVTCTNKSFGDPAYKVNKQCYYLIPERHRTPGLQFCAQEGGVCDAPAGSVVVYGITGRYTEPVRISRPIRCGLISFGADPAVGTVKSCFIVND